MESADTSQVVNDKEQFRETKINFILLAKQQNLAFQRLFFAQACILQLLHDLNNTSVEHKLQVQFKR